MSPICNVKMLESANEVTFLDVLAPTPVSQWVSQSLIVSDLELAIGSPSFASLFSFLKHSSWLNMVMVTLVSKWLHPGCMMAMC